jgi:hypothetical protein
LKKAHIHSESRELVLAAFDLLGLKTQAITDCRQLAEEIRYRTGQSVSPSTIYRMLNSEKQRVNASLRSMQILKSLIERLHNDFIQPLPTDRLRRIYDKDGQGLQELISTLFRSESNELKKWFTALPLDYGSLGWEQLLIGKALGQALRAHKAPLDSPWIRNLIKTPQFTLYYTKTMWDLNEPESFFVPILEMQLGFFKERIAQEEDELSLETIDSVAFCSAMLLFIRYLTEKKKKIADLRTYMEAAEFQSVRDRSMELHVLPRTRLMCSCFLVHEKEDEIPELIQSVRASLKEEFRSRYDPKWRELAYSVLCDALILRNDVPELIEVLSELPQPRADAVISDAAFVRMERYRSLFLPTEGSNKRKQIQGASFIHGWNELNLHELLMMKAQRLAGESIDRTAAEELIGQSGFVHFNGLLD